MSETPGLDHDDLPVTLDAAGLGRLLFRSESTIRADLSRRPDQLPDGIRTGKRTLWLRETVMEWLRNQQRPLIETRRTRVKKVAGPTSKLGRPSKAEQVEAHRLDISVPEFRRRASTAATTPSASAGSGGAK